MLLQPLEFAINQYLKMDPDTIDRLGRLEGRVIKLEIVDWRIRFFIIPTKQGVELLTYCSEDITTTLRGNLFDLIKISHAKGDTKTLFKNKIEIEGDTKTGEAIQKILSQIEIDWEEQLSKITGDIVAHRAGNSVRQLRELTKKTLKTLNKNITNFLQLETQQLPSKREVHEFCEAVTKLHQDVERLEAKLNQLKRQ